jgi:hypothetical protein
MSLLPRIAFLILASLLGAVPARAGAPEEPNRIVIGGGGGEYTTKTKSFLDMRFNDVVRQKYDYSCGSAALATLLTYDYGMPVSETQVLEEMYEVGDRAKIVREGFSLLDMKKYLASRGLRAEGYRQSLDKLAKVGIPAIVLINRNGYMHFVVLRGITDDKVLIADSATGLRATDRKEFESQWNNILFVITDKMNVARASFNTQAAWGKRQMAKLGPAMPDADLASYALSISYSPNYY